MIKRFIFISLLLIPTFLYGYTVKTQHPRLLISPETAPIYNYSAQTINRTMYDNIFIGSFGVELNYVNPTALGTDGCLAYAARASFIVSIGTVSGHSYVHSIDQYAVKGIEALMYWANNQTINCINLDMALIAYDGLFDKMTMTERERAVKRFIAIQNYQLDTDWGRMYQPLGSKSVARYTMCSSIGFAFAGDGAYIGTGSSATYYNAVATTSLSNFDSVYRNRILYGFNWAKGAWFAGPDYSRVYMHYLFLANEFCMTACENPPNLYQDYKDFYQGFVKYTYQTLAPESRRFVRLGDVRYANAGLIYSEILNDPSYSRGLGTALAIVSTRAETNNDDYTSKIANFIIRTSTLTAYNNPYMLIFDSSTRPGMSISTMAVTEKFENTGLIFMRSHARGNSDIIMPSTATYIVFGCHPYYMSNHDNAGVNYFIIHKSTPLAIRSGCYENGDKWNHEKNYHYRSIAFNQVLVYDPCEKFIFEGPCYNDGGAKFHASQPSQMSELTPDSQWYCGGGIVKFQEKSDYVYVRGDASKAFLSSKVILNQRDFLYLKGNNEYVVCYDRITEGATNYTANLPNSSKKWLLHCQNNPSIAGTETAIQEGIYSYTGSTAYVNGGTGQMYLKVLKPDNFQIKKIGYDITNQSGNNDGSNHNFTTWDSTNNFKCGYNNTGAWYSIFKFKNEYGKYRIEVIPTGPDIKQANTFLTVMQPCLSGIGQTPAFNIIVNSGNVEGTHIRDGARQWVCIFSKSSDTVNSEINYTVLEANQVKHIVSGLKANTKYGIVFTGTDTNYMTSIAENTNGTYTASAQGIIEFSKSRQKMIYLKFEE